MSEGMNQQILLMMTAYSHRISTGDTLNEFEALAYEQMCRLIETICKASRYSWEKHVLEQEKEQGDAAE